MVIMNGAIMQLGTWVEQRFSGFSQAWEVRYLGLTEKYEYIAWPKMWSLLFNNHGLCCADFRKCNEGNNEAHTS